MEKITGEPSLVGRKESEGLSGIKLPKITGSRLMGSPYAYNVSPYFNGKYLKKHLYAGDKIQGSKIPYNSPFKMAPLIAHKVEADSLKGNGVVGTNKAIYKSPQKELGILGGKQLLMKNKKKISSSKLNQLKTLNQSNIVDGEKEIALYKNGEHKNSVGALITKKKTGEYKKENEVY
jgi:hypothetical protein